VKESEDGDGMDDDLYFNDDDRKQLNSLPESKREAILFERREKRKDQEMRKRLKNLNRVKPDSNENDKPDTKEPDLFFTSKDNKEPGDAPSLDDFSNSDMYTESKIKPEETIQTNQTYKVEKTEKPVEKKENLVPSNEGGSNNFDVFDDIYGGDAPAPSDTSSNTANNNTSNQTNNTALKVEKKNFNFT